MKTCWNYILSIVAVAIMTVSCTYRDSIAMDTVYYNNVCFRMLDCCSLETKSQTAVGLESDARCIKEAIQYNKPDNSTAFGLVGIGNESGRVLIPNQAVYNSNGARMSQLAVNTELDDNMLMSVFYPYTNKVIYNQDGKYAVAFNSDDICKGPMMAEASISCKQQNGDVDISFTNIYSSIGLGVCDLTKDEQLKGLIHVRKVVLHGIQVEGLYVYNGLDSHWEPQRRAKSITVYDGCDSVLAGNVLYLSDCSVSEQPGECKRINAIPEILTNGIQTVEVIYDVDPFEYEGTHYSGMTQVSQIVSLTDLIPGNSLEQGSQYTCTIGLDLGRVYRTIEFTAIASNWNSVEM